jgi:hypothetical protein
MMRNRYKELWKNLLNLIFVSVCITAFAGTATASSVYIDVGHDGYAGTGYDTTTLTDPWSQATIIADTHTTQYDTDGSGGKTVNDEFVDQGHAAFTSYAFLPGFAGDNEGLNQLGTGYEITMVWKDLTGHIIQVGTPGPSGVSNDNIVYTKGTVEFYLDSTYDYNMGATVSPADDTGFGDGLNFLTIQITGGTGTNTFDLTGFLQGASNFTGKVTKLDSGWLFQHPDGLDLSTVIEMQWLYGELDQNTQRDGIIFTDGTTDDVLFSVDSRHDGSINFNAVPVPASALLFGAGLAGIAGFRRRFRKEED